MATATIKLKDPRPVPIEKITLELDEREALIIFGVLHSEPFKEAARKASEQNWRKLADPDLDAAYSGPTQQAISSICRALTNVFEQARR